MASTGYCITLLSLSLFLSPPPPHINSTASTSPLHAPFRSDRLTPAFTLSICGLCTDRDKLKANVNCIKCPYAEPLQAVIKIYSHSTPFVWLLCTNPFQRPLQSTIRKTYRRSLQLELRLSR